MKSIAVIGVGNILFTDDGAGVYAAAYLKNNYRFEPAVEIIDGGTLGFNLMHYLLEYDRVLILDTLSIEDNAGSIYHLDSDALLGLGDCRKTVHEIEVTQMIELGSMMGMRAQVSIVGIVPADIQSVAINLTKEIQSEFDAFVQASLAVLTKSGIDARSNEFGATLDGIMESYRNPQIRIES